MNRFKKISGILFIIIIITIVLAMTIQILIKNEHIIMAQLGPGGPGVIPIDPENVTNQTLQGYPTADKNMSTGIAENE